MEEPIERTPDTAVAEPAGPDLDGYASYEDGDHLVICDRENPNAWIRSNETADLRG